MNSTYTRSIQPHRQNVSHTTAVLGSHTTRPVLHPPLRSPHRVVGAIDAAAEEDIRMALLMVANGESDRKKDPLAAFSRTNNAAATCETSGTAGGDGLDLCVKRCESKPSTWDLRTPTRGACYTLCSLAISPCTRR